MLKVLVTGGCGFIGSNFIHYLLETDPEVTVVNFDCLTYAGNLDSLAPIAANPRYEFLKADICDLAAMRDAVGRFQPDVINLTPGVANSVAYGGTASSND